MAAACDHNFTAGQAGAFALSGDQAAAMIRPSASFAAAPNLPEQSCRRNKSVNVLDALRRGE